MTRTWASPRASASSTWCRTRSWPVVGYHMPFPALGFVEKVGHQLSLGAGQLAIPYLSGSTEPEIVGRGSRPRPALFQRAAAGGVKSPNPPVDARADARRHEQGDRGAPAARQSPTGCAAIPQARSQAHIGRRGRGRSLPRAHRPQARGAPGRNPKCLNENLAPLRRYLAKQAGRPWDQVFSEISGKIRLDNAVQKHVRDHVHDFVASTTRLKDGVIYVVDRSDRLVPLAEARWLDLYVHPATGVLRRTDGAARSVCAAGARSLPPSMSLPPACARSARIASCICLTTAIGGR